MQDFKRVYGIQASQENTTTDFAEVTEQDCIDAMVKEFKILKHTQESIFQNPKLKALLEDQRIDSATFLSKYTILQNNLSSVATNQLLL